MTLSADQLQQIRSILAEQVAAGDARAATLLRETDAALARATARELVFRLELPLDPVNVGRRKPCLVKLAPTLNEYASMAGWARGLARTAVDRRILVARARWPRWHCGAQKRAKAAKGKIVMQAVPGTGRRRLVRVVRSSSRRIDEVSVDVVGGKLPLDRLVRAGILAGDSAKWLDREAAWEPAQPGEGRVVIEVYDLTADATERRPRG